jgi:hypothetical protein
MYLSLFLALGQNRFRHQSFLISLPICRLRLSPNPISAREVKTKRASDHLLTAENRAAPVADQPCATRSRLLPNGLQRRGLVRLHPRTPEAPRQCMRLEYVWRNFPNSYNYTIL